MSGRFPAIAAASVALVAAASCGNENPRATSETGAVATPQSSPARDAPITAQDEPASGGEPIPAAALSDLAHETFVAYGCYQCHGYQGHGGGAGPRLSAPLLPYEAFEQIVRRPYGVMPAYPAELLSEETMRDIYAYLQTIPEPAPLEDIPLLDGRLE